MKSETLAIENLEKEELGKRIYQVSYLRGEFKLRSGQTSKEYFDKYRFEARPEILFAIAKHMLALIPKETEILAGLEMGGIPLATALSFLSNLPIVFVRKKAKEYGTCQFAEGIDVQGKKVCIIEDVITTGGQALLSCQDLRQMGAQIDTILCVINRNSGGLSPFKSEINSQAPLNLKALFTMDELKKYENN